MRAILIHKESGKRIDTKAKKVNSRWYIGGDVAAAWGGYTIFIENEKGLYILKGSRMIRQDNAGALD